MNSSNATLTHGHTTKYNRHQILITKDTGVLIALSLLTVTATCGNNKLPSRHLTAYAEVHNAQLHEFTHTSRKTTRCPQEAIYIY